jgi:putative endonuclease
MYHVYVLRSLNNGKKYIGLTSLALEERLRQHNYGSNKWTKANGPFKLIHSENFPCKAEARRRELFLKSETGRRVLDRIA